MSVASSNRTALSPVKDSHLNSSSSSSTSSSSVPLSKITNSSISTPQKKSLNNNFSYFTPNNIKKRRPDLMTKSFSSTTSSTSLITNSNYIKKNSPLRSVSFSDYGSNKSSITTSPRNVILQKFTINQFKNDSAGLAATKLKVRLQMAIFKIQQGKRLSTPSLKTRQTRPHYQHQQQQVSKSSTTLKSPPTSCKGSPIDSPTSITPLATTKLGENCIKTTTISFNSSSSSLPTPPEQPATHKFLTNSININLKGQSFKQTSTSLSKVAKSKSLNKNQTKKLHLFKIKKDSLAYKPNKKLPLVQNDIKSKSTKSFSHMNIFNNPSFINSTSSIIEKENHLPSITSNKNIMHSSYSLPSINKILKTPIKQANSHRYMTSFHNEHPQPPSIASRLPTTVDDTIDEDQNDTTVLQSTTFNNTTIDQNATIQEKDNDDDEQDIDANVDKDSTENGHTKSTNSDLDDTSSHDEQESILKKDILTSSPLNNHFGTPNSFSIAKSLLELGGHRM